MSGVRVLSEPQRGARIQPTAQAVGTKWNKCQAPTGRKRRHVLGVPLPVSDARTSTNRGTWRSERESSSQ